MISTASSSPLRANLRAHAVRRLLAVGIVALFSAVLVPAVAAQADTSSTLTVVGTSDVQDSGLVPNLITPMFKKAFPQFTLNYVSLGTGAAINFAEAGTASALIVHAASLENQFVAGGFSKERFGRAVFWGDYVLLGPKSDPAHVLTGAPHDIVTAFQDIAAAGAGGKADFVSRANTSGTAVQEHKIWSLAAPSSTLTLCPVSTANGGGSAPSSTSTCGATPSYPSWYHATGLTQGPNIENANTCNYPNASAGNDCYVFTDRGTFECLMTASCAGGSAAPTNLQIVGNNNSASARGGNTLLVNSFHAYAINPAKFASNPNVAINSTAAEDLLNFLQSPGFQVQLKSYLAGTGGAPFIADASPLITGKLPKRAQAGKKITVSGSVSNVVPGTPAIVGAKVTLSEVVSGLAAGIPIASAKTNSKGAYKLSFVAPSTGSYQLTTPQLTQVEIPSPTLTPEFGDILAPGASTASKITVQGVLKRVSIKSHPGQVVATGQVLPGSGHVHGSVTMLARRGSTGRFKAVAVSKLGANDDVFALVARLAAGKWSVELRFQDGGVLTSTTRSVKVSVPAASTASVGVRSLTVKRGRATLNGTLKPASPSAGTKLELLAVDLGALPNAKRPTTTAGTKPIKLVLVGTAKLRDGATKFTLRFTIRRGQRWAIELGYLPAGSAPAYTKTLRTVNVS
jgi:tungstate transport system substrate-binding protein